MGSAGLLMLQRPRSGETTQCRSQHWRHSALQGLQPGESYTSQETKRNCTCRRRTLGTVYPAGPAGTTGTREGEKSLSPPVPHQNLQPARLNIMPAGKEEILTKSTSMVTWKAKKHRFGAEENKLKPGIFVFIT